MTTEDFEQIRQTAILDDREAQTLASFAKLVIKNGESED